MWQTTLKVQETTEKQPEAVDAITHRRSADSRALLDIYDDELLHLLDFKILKTRKIAQKRAQKFGKKLAHMPVSGACSPKLTPNFVALHDVFTQLVLSTIKSSCHGLLQQPRAVRPSLARRKSNTAKARKRKRPQCESHHDGKASMEKLLLKSNVMTMFV